MPWLTAQKVAGILETAPNTSPVVERPTFGYTQAEPDKTDTGPTLARLSKPTNVVDDVSKPPVTLRPSSVTGAVGKGLQYVGDLFNPKTAASFYVDKAHKVISTSTPLSVGKTYRAILTPVGSRDRLLKLRGKQITFLGHGVQVLDTGMWKDSKDVFVVFKIG